MRRDTQPRGLGYTMLFDSLTESPRLFTFYLLR